MGVVVEVSKGGNAGRGRGPVRVHPDAAAAVLADVAVRLRPVGNRAFDHACPFQCKTMMPSEATPVVSPIAAQAFRAEYAAMDALPISARLWTAGGNGGNKLFDLRVLM